MQLLRRQFLHLAAGATRPAGPAGPPGGGGGGGRPFGQNVLDYGANPTGQSDSVGAFEAAMKAVRSAGYGLIKVPLGKYRFSRACNLDVVNSQYGVRFEGEANSVQRFGNQSSTILGPAGDYAFKSLDAGNTAAGLQHVFQNLAIGSSGGGIFMSDGGIIVRDCLFYGGGHHIQLDQAWKSYIGQTSFIGPGRPGTGNIGVAVFGQEVTLDTVDFFAMGTGVVLQGESMEIRQMRCESSGRALILGQDQSGNQSFLTNFRISIGEMESNSREIWIRNAARGYIECFPILGHEIYDGDVRTQYAIQVDNAAQVKLAYMQFGGSYSQAAIVSNNISQCKLEMCQGRNGLSAKGNASYPAGTTQIQISRSVFDTALPGWLVPGLTVTDVFSPSTLQPGTVVQQVIQPDTIVFSKPTASTIIGSGYPPSGNESIQGNLLAFSDPQGNPVGFFDGPASGNWVQELCDVGR